MSDKPKVLKYKTYLLMIENSVGSTQYRNLWGEWPDGRVEDLTKGGELSCAVFVTSILKLFDVIGEQKATVKGAVERMKNDGWKNVDIDCIEPGDVIVWKRNKTDYTHPHIGFYIGNNLAVSNSWKLNKVVRHSWNYGGKRDVVEVLRWTKW